MTIRDVLGEELDQLIQAGKSREVILATALRRKKEVLALKKKIEDANYKDEIKHIKSENKDVDKTLQKRFAPLKTMVLLEK